MKFYQSLFFALLCCASLRIQGAAKEHCREKPQRKITLPISPVQLAVSVFDALKLYTPKTAYHPIVTVLNEYMEQAHNILWHANNFCSSPAKPEKYISIKRLTTDIERLRNTMCTANQTTVSHDIKELLQKEKKYLAALHTLHSANIKNSTHALNTDSDSDDDDELNTLRQAPRQAQERLSDRDKLEDARKAMYFL